MQAVALGVSLVVGELRVFWQFNICSCLFKSPRDMSAVIIYECHIGYAFRTALNNTD